MAVTDVRYITKKEAAKMTREKLRDRPIALSRFEQQEKTRRELEKQAERTAPYMKITSWQEPKAIGTVRKLVIKRQPVTRDIPISQVVNIQQQQIQEQRIMPRKETISREPIYIPKHTTEYPIKEFLISERVKTFEQAPTPEKIKRTLRSTFFGLGGEQIIGVPFSEKKLSRAVAETEHKTYSALGSEPTTIKRLEVSSKGLLPSLSGYMGAAGIFGRVSTIPKVATVLKTTPAKAVIGGAFVYSVGSEAKHIQKLFTSGEKARGIGAGVRSFAELGGFYGGYKLGRGESIMPQILSIKDLKKIYGRGILKEIGLSEKDMLKKDLKIELIEPMPKIKRPTPKPEIIPSLKIEEPFRLTPGEKSIRDLFRYKLKEFPPEKTIITSLSQTYIQKGEKIIFSTKTGPLEVTLPKLKIKTRPTPKPREIIKLEDIKSPVKVARYQEVVIRKPLKTEKQMLKSLRRQFMLEKRVLRIPEDLPKRGVKFEEVKVLRKEIFKTRKGTARMVPVSRQIFKPIISKIQEYKPITYAKDHMKYMRQFDLGMKQHYKGMQSMTHKPGEVYMSKMKSISKTKMIQKIEEPLLFGYISGYKPIVSGKIGYSVRQIMKGGIKNKYIDKLSYIPDIRRPKLKKERIIKPIERGISFKSGSEDYAYDQEPIPIIPRQIIKTPRPPIPKITDKESLPFSGMPVSFPMMRDTKVKRIQNIRGYNVIVPVKGKMVNMNKGRMTRRQALSFGADVVDNSEAASFGIRLSGKLAKPPKILIPSFEDRKFRYRKKDNFFVEHRRHRIDTLGEIHGISAKGWAKKRMMGAGKNVNRIFGGFM